jgi:antitoxin component of RelBE/YafQ-DinJ toxin-antitoxin module
MTTQVIFNLDKKLKDQAMKKARHQGIALSSILKMATQAFVDGDFKVGLLKEEVFNTKTQKSIERALKDLKTGKNISGPFTTTEELMAHLNNS